MATRSSGVAPMTTRFITATHVYPAPRSASAVGMLSTVAMTMATSTTRRPPRFVSDSPG
jgi:hypothetical protein